ncbi:MAG TPA: NADPH-dependent F420 reductase [Polyangiales bacterium]|nr:NADPH-dependent F420 reductase [Polyangiales bacterium]
MKIGILGTGAVGNTLASAFLTLGHEVKMGSRKAGNDKARAWLSSVNDPKASEGSFANAVEFGEVIVFATLGAANADVVSAVGSDAFKGKLVIDSTNPLEFSTGKPLLSVGHTDSGGEQLQRALPSAHVVKAFNTVGNTHMFRPDFVGGPPSMFIAGDDDGAKQRVTELLRAFGWDVVDLGGIESSRYLEAICMAWVVYGLRNKSWDHAFKLLRK